MRIFHNYDIEHPEFYRVCLRCKSTDKDRMAGPFDTLAEAQHPGNSMCEPCKAEFMDEFQRKLEAKEILI
jgi:DNA-directed RNA polymerase subunit L